MTPLHEDAPEQPSSVYKIFGSSEDRKKVGAYFAQKANQATREVNNVNEGNTFAYKASDGCLYPAMRNKNTWQIRKYGERGARLCIGRSFYNTLIKSLRVDMQDTPDLVTQLPKEPEQLLRPAIEPKRWGFRSAINFVIGNTPEASPAKTGPEPHEIENKRRMEEYFDQLEPALEAAFTRLGSHLAAHPTLGIRSQSIEQETEVVTRPRRLNWLETSDSTEVLLPKTKDVLTLQPSNKSVSVKKANGLYVTVSLHAVTGIVDGSDFGVPGVHIETNGKALRITPTASDTPIFSNLQRLRDSRGATWEEAGEQEQAEELPALQ